MWKVLRLRLEQVVAPAVQSYLAPLNQYKRQSPHAPLLTHAVAQALDQQESLDNMASFTKQTSALKNIPSINDFNSLTHEDLEPYEPEFNVRVPTARPIDRSWSVESNAETPRRYACGAEPVVVVLTDACRVPQQLNAVLVAGVSQHPQMDVAVATCPARTERTWLLLVVCSITRVSITAMQCVWRGPC